MSACVFLVNKVKKKVKNKGKFTHSNPTSTQTLVSPFFLSFFFNISLAALIKLGQYAARKLQKEGSKGGKGEEECVDRAEEPRNTSRLGRQVVSCCKIDVETERERHIYMKGERDRQREREEEKGS